MMEAILPVNFFDTCVPFVAGCSSGMIATICVQPIDTIKVRMQLTEQRGKQMMLARTREIINRDGFFNLYDGLSAALLRQLVYGTMRLGLFSTFEQLLEIRAHERGTTLGFGGRTLAGVSAGALAALIGTPTEVTLIRMQADSLQPVGQRRQYSSAFNALGRISKQDGVFALWKGAAPTIVRAMSTNFGQLAFFSESKHQLKKHSDFSPWVQAGMAAAIAGFAGAFVSLPFDFVKTRLQNQSKAASENALPLYKGTMDCFIQVARREGILRFYQDFWPYLFRVVPHSIIALFLLDCIKDFMLSKRWNGTI